MRKLMVLGLVLLILAVVWGIAAYIRRKPTEDVGPEKLSQSAVGTLEKASVFLKDGNVQAVAELTMEEPGSRAVRLIAEIGRRHATADANFDFVTPFREKDGNTMPLYKAIASSQTPAEAYVTMLHAPSLAVRAVAISGIAERKERAAVPRLIEIAETTEELSELSRTVEALAIIRDKRAVAVLKKFAATQGISDHVVIAAKEALAAMGEVP